MQSEDDGITGDPKLDRRIVITKVSLEIYTAGIVTAILAVLKGWL